MSCGCFAFSPLLHYFRAVLDPGTGKPQTTTVELFEGEGPGHYSYLDIGGEDCKDASGKPTPAIIFGDEPQPDEEITITFEGDPGLD